MTALVTGGGGFLGLAIVRQLRARGHAVRAFQRGHYPALDAFGVESVRGDLTDAQAVAAAARGADVVFHVAARAGVWGRYRDFHGPNVAGTQNVIDACRLHHVPRLVFTSSPSVVFDGRDESGIDEAAPYPPRYLANYPRTKAMAERLVLAANGPDLATVALRPHLIWGPADPHLVPRVVARARAGRLRLVGNGLNLVDSTYVDNAAAAHVLAADRLAPGAPSAGRAYFLSNGEPLGMAELINRILAAAGLPPVTRTISARAAYAAGAVLELAHALLRRNAEPAMTRFVARQLAAAHWFDLTAIRRDLGYEPAISIDEGMRRLAASLRSEGRP